MKKRQKMAATRPSLGKAGEHNLSNTLLLSITLLGVIWASHARAVPVTAPVGGEIEKITINDINDHWSGGVIVAGGQNIIIPQNLLMDLPANRVTLQQLFTEASASCQTQNETGLAKGDTCNKSGTGGIATIMATRNDNGHVIAGDVLIQKGVESITGNITYIDYAQGYFRVNGKVGSAVEGYMVRLNDPDGRHTLQSGLGCAIGSQNCSADPRFTLDGDNYTNVFSNGYPMCIPSTQSRSFIDSLGLGVTTAQALVDGMGDVLCPATNRPGAGLTVADSRRFAPILVGDSITVEGNYEEVGGVHFLSAHSTTVSAALATNLNDLSQPDYLYLDEVEVDAPGFQNRRARSLIIGYSTLPPDIMFWSIHYDPSTNSPHEFPLATTAGCDNSSGVGTCTAQGFAAAGAAGGNIFKIRHDVDFALPNIKPRWNPCAHLQGDPRFNAVNPCSSDPGGTIAEQFAILSPIPHEIQARTGRKFASMQPGGIPLLTVDIQGNEATNGQYLFPFGIGLGGVSVPEMVEIDLNALNTPTSFSGIPWNLDRRLSPGGCLDTNNDGIGECEATPQPLDPFPFEGTDPRTLSTIPAGGYSDPGYVSGSLNNVSDRILSFVNANATRPGGNGIGVNDTGNFTAALLDWQALPPSAGGPGSSEAIINATPALPQAQICTANSTFNSPPVAQADSDWATPGVAKTIWVLSNDSDADGDPLSVTGLRVSVGSAPLTTITTSNGNIVDLAVNGGVTFTPALNFSGTDTFFYDVTDGQITTTGTVTINVNTAAVNHNPVALNDGVSTFEGTPVVVHILEYASDPDGDPLTVTSVGTAAHGTVILNASIATYTPNANFIGVDTFTYVVGDGKGGSATGTATITVIPKATTAIPPAVSVATNTAPANGVGTNSPVLVFTKKLINFGTVARNTQKDLKATVKNIGNVLVKPRFVIKGKGFSKVSTSCTTLAVNRSCNVVVRFNAPAKPETAKGTLSVTGIGMQNIVTTELSASTR